MTIKKWTRWALVKYYISWFGLAIGTLVVLEAAFDKGGYWVILLWIMTLCLGVSTNDLWTKIKHCNNS